MQSSSPDASGAIIVENADGVPSSLTTTSGDEQDSGPSSIVLPAATNPTTPDSHSSVPVSPVTDHNPAVLLRIDEDHGETDESSVPRSCQAEESGESHTPRQSTIAQSSAATDTTDTTTVPRLDIAFSQSPRSDGQTAPSRSDKTIIGADHVPASTALAISFPAPTPSLPKTGRPQELSQLRQQLYLQSQTYVAFVDDYEAKLAAASEEQDKLRTLVAARDLALAQAKVDGDAACIQRDQTIAQVGAQLGRLGQTLDNKDAIIIDLKGQLVSCNRDVHQTAVAVSKHEETISQLKHQLERQLEARSKIALQHKFTKSELDRHQKAAKEHEQEVAKYKSEIEKGEEALREATELAAARQKTIDRLENDLKQEQAARADADSKVTTLEAESDQHQLAFDEQTRTIANSTKSLSASRQEVTSLQATKALQIRKIARLELSVEKTQRRLVSMEKAVEAHASRLATTKRQLSDADAGIISQQSTIAEQKASINKKDQELKTLGQEAKQLRGNKQRFDALQDQLAVKDRALEVLQATIKEKTKEADDQERKQEVFQAADKEMAERAVERAREAGFLAGQESQEAAMNELRTKSAAFQAEAVAREEELEELVRLHCRHADYLYTNPPVRFVSPGDMAVSDSLDQLQARTIQATYLRDRLQRAPPPTNGSEGSNHQREDREQRHTTPSSSRKRARSTAAPDQHRHRSRDDFSPPADADCPPTPPPTASPTRSCNISVARDDPRTISRYRATFLSKGHCESAPHHGG